jgi:NAD(P) transhydrogenase subunit alpha
VSNRRGLLLALAPALALLLIAGLSLAQDDQDSPTVKNLRNQYTQAVELAKPPSTSTESETSDDETPPAPTDAAVADGPSNRSQVLISSLTIFVLAVFVGFEVITKVPPTLHTPLMSGSNAISGITLVGAVILAARSLYFSPFIAFLAVILATINVMGGFLVTHRMLSMFQKR